MMPEHETARLELLARHARRLDQLYSAARVPATLSAFPEAYEVAATLGELLVDSIEAEQDFGSDVLRGCVEPGAEDWLGSRLKWAHHLVEQAEALIVELGSGS